MTRSLTIFFNSDTKTLYISGNGEITWKDTVVFSEVTEHIVIEGNGVFCTNASNLFANFEYLVNIEGTIDTSKCKDMSYFYSHCHRLIKPIADLDTSSAEEFDFFHNDNESLRSAVFNSTLNGVKFAKMFNNCTSLASIEGLSIPDGVDLVSVSNVEFVIFLLSRGTDGNSKLYG